VVGKQRGGAVSLGGKIVAWKCGRCLKVLKLTEYHLDKNNKLTGRQRRCKGCTKAVARERARRARDGGLSRIVVFVPKEDRRKLDQAAAAAGMGVRAYVEGALADRCATLRVVAETADLARRKWGESTGGGDAAGRAGGARRRVLE